MHLSCEEKSLVVLSACFSLEDHTSSTSLAQRLRTLAYFCDASGEPRTPDQLVIPGSQASMLYDSNARCPHRMFLQHDKVKPINLSYKLYEEQCFIFRDIDVKMYGDNKCKLSNITRKYNLPDIQYYQKIQFT